MIWVGLDGDELVSGHLDGRQRKLAEHPPRPAGHVVLVRRQRRQRIRMRDCLVLHGTARITEGGAAQLLHDLAQTGSLWPGTVFPLMPNPPAGFINHITVDRVGGSGPWT